MKQIVDKLNKIAKKINENVELSDRDLIIDSLDSITKAYGGTPNDSTLIVDKLEDIYNNIEPAVSGNIEITENGENINVAPYATATVNVSGGGDTPTCCTATIVDSESTGDPITFPDMFLNTDYLLVSGASTYPYTVYAFYLEDPEDNSINNLSFMQPAEYYSAGNFTNLVNCEVITNAYDDGVEWGISVLDKTLPSSITIDTKAFNEGA